MTHQKPASPKNQDARPRGLFSGLRVNLFQAKGAADNTRVNAMSDGVFSIVITLMVFSIKVPDVPSTELPQALLKSWPDIASMLLSFVILGIYWVGHNNVFQHVIRHDRLMLWLNIFFLLVVALIPFQASMLIRYNEIQLSHIIYAANLAIGGLLLDFIWWYATLNKHLMCDTVTPALIRSFHYRILTGPILYLIAIGVSFFSLLGAKILFALAILYYLVPTAQDLLHHEQLSN